MKILHSLVFISIAVLLLPTGCKDKKNDIIPVDSSQITPPGKVSQIVLTTNEFIDTGAIVTIKGKGFDPHMKDGYFLFVKHEDTKQRSWDTLIQPVFKSSAIIRDSNLVSINDSIIIFKLPKYSLYLSYKDSAFLYFAKWKKSALYINNQDHTKRIEAIVKAKKEMINLPIYKLLRDTLILSKKYNPTNKEMIQGSMASGAIKVVIQGLEYQSKDGYFLRDDDYNQPAYKRTTLSMVATQDLFYLPDGWYSFEIFERNDKQRRFVEETGKTKVYIKNVP